MEEARRHGVASDAVVRWVRRKHGGDVAVRRPLSGGAQGVATPCVLCRAALLRFGMRVSFVASPDGGAFRGHLDRTDAPRSGATSRQRRLWGWGRRGADDEEN